MGTPRVYCECSVCMEARSSGTNIRLRSSLWLEEAGQEPIMLDCGPDWRAQMESLPVRHVSQALVTHAHFDHIGGLTEWADSCRWTDLMAKLFAPSEVLNEIKARFPWVQRQLHMQENDGGMGYGQWRITPWKVNHGKNGYAYAYLFENQATGIKWAYCSDSIHLTEQQKAPLIGLTLLVLGTSYAEEPYPMDTRSVYDMKEGLQLAAEVNPQALLFTHLSHGIDMNTDYGLPAYARLAHTGMMLTV
jgi:phosphoribosyl 1,2-cyclic phosphate phosphodiesterase